MIGSQFIDLLTKYRSKALVSVEDYADRLSFVYSVTLFLVISLVITAKSYIFHPIACYHPSVPGGANFKDFALNYCWVHGTIPLRNGEATPSNQKEWAEMDRTRRLGYYQWVPFVLGLQCILFYLPRVLWQLICYNRSGTDLEALVVTVSRAAHAITNEMREKELNKAVGDFETMLFQHRDMRKGRIADWRRKLYRKCGMLVVSKRLGTWLVAAYLIIKMMYLANAVGQLFLMKAFLGFNSTMTHFGIELARHMTAGTEWTETLYFPRKAYCSIEIRHLGSRYNRFNAVCALPINMINEKVYIFLWFWTVFVAIMTSISLPLWFIRINIDHNRVGFIKRSLRLSERYKRADRGLVDRFLDEFLRHDGIFLLRMMSLNAGDVITTEIIGRLWETYKKKYVGRDFREDIPKDNESKLANRSGASFNPYDENSINSIVRRKQKVDDEL